MEAPSDLENYSNTGSYPVPGDLTADLVQQHDTLKEKMGLLSYDDLVKIESLRSLDREHKLLVSITCTDAHVERMYNTEEYTKYNRYGNIMCYKANAVTIEDHLSSLPSTETNYINANSIMNPNSGEKEELIGTQGPLDPLTLTNFWRMIFMKKSSLIVMLCNLVEEGRKKCGQYFPENRNEVMEFGHFRVKCTDVRETNGFYETRRLEVTDTIAKETRQITQLHAVNWPDFGVPGPEHYADLGHLVEEMISHYASTKTPITVHCSAGVGRTGTTAATYFLFKQALRYKEMGFTLDNLPGFCPFGVVRSLREQRVWMVQNGLQYRCVHSLLRSKLEAIFK